MDDRGSGCSRRAGGGCALGAAPKADRARFPLAVMAAAGVVGGLAVAAVGDCRYLFTGIADSAVCVTDGGMLVSHFASVPPLAEPAPLFRSDGGKLGAQPGNTAERQNHGLGDDGLFVCMAVVWFPGALVDGRGGVGGMFGGGGVDVAVADGVIGGAADRVMTHQP